LKHPQLQDIADKFKMMRDIVYKNIMDARLDNERIQNADRKMADFSLGDRVFISQVLQSSKITNPKHSPPKIGPFIIIDKQGAVVKLQHLSSGKILRNWINVCHLTRLRDEGRRQLYNRLKGQYSDGNDTVDIHQPTVQTVVSTGHPWDNINQDCVWPSSQRCKQDGGT